MLPLRTLLAASALVCSSAGQGVSEVTPSNWTIFERTEIASCTIVRGSLQLPETNALRRAIERGGAYVEFLVQVQETLKGERRPQLRLMFFAAPPLHPHGYSPHAEDMQGLIGSSCILMLQRVGDRFFLAERFHGVAVAADTPDARTRTAACIALHESMAGEVPGPDAALSGEVEEILEEIAEDPDAEFLGFTRLQALGPEAVPAIVRHLEDPRAIRSPSIALFARHADQPEPLVRIHLRSFGDALFTVLQQMTGQGFGFDSRNPDPTRRGIAARGWRIYAQYALADQRDARITSRRIPR
jgi:hypothetical protein